MPRDLSIENDKLVVSAIPETKVLRVPGSKQTATIEAQPENEEQRGQAQASIAPGSQVEISLSCTGTPSSASGKIAVRTLASADGKYYTEIGYDLSNAEMPFYVDHSHCCTKPSNFTQRAILSKEPTGTDDTMTVFVDGGLIEAYTGGTVITPLLNPDEAAGGAPDARVSSVVNTASGVKCTVTSYKLAY